MKKQILNGQILKGQTNLKVKCSVGCVVNFISDEYEQAKQFIEGLKEIAKKC